MACAFSFGSIFATAFCVLSASGVALPYQLVQEQMAQGQVAAPAALQSDSETARSSILMSPEATHPQQTLIICNAYTSDQALDVSILRNQQKLTNAKPLAYKSCGDYVVPLQEGDQLEFEVGKFNVGTFAARGLPNTDSSLLLVPFKKHAENRKASFASHAFSDLHSSQIVVVDTYLGSAVGKVNIMDVPEPTVQQSAKPQQEVAQTPRAEALNFNSVVAVNAGHYQVMLNDNAGKQVSEKILQVEQSRAKYVVLRVGGEGSTANTTQAAFPQELLVYPENSGAWAQRLNFIAFLAIGLAGLVGL